MRIGFLIFLVILIAIVLFIIKDRSGSPRYPSSSGYSFFVFGWTLFKWVLLNLAILGSLLLLEDLIHVPITFGNVIRITTALFLPYVAFSITLNSKSS